MSAKRELRPERSQLRTLVSHELSLSLRSLLAWAIPVGAMLATTLSVQRSMSERGSLFEQKLALMPREVRAAFGFDAPNLSEPVHYLATNATFFTLVGAIFAALLGAALASREAAQRTSELLLTQPVLRRTVMGAKAAAGLLVVLAFDAALCAAGAISYALAGVSVARWSAFCAVFVGAALVHATLFALGLLAGVSAQRPRSAASAALGAAFALYGLGVFARASPRLTSLEWLSPFAYADAGEIARIGGLPSKSVALVLATAALLTLARVRFDRRDIDA